MSFPTQIYSGLGFFLYLPLQCQKEKSDDNAVFEGYTSKNFGARKSSNKYDSSLADAVFDILIIHKDFSLHICLLF